MGWECGGRERGRGLMVGEMGRDWGVGALEKWAVIEGRVEGNVPEV